MPWNINKYEQNWNRNISIFRVTLHVFYWKISGIPEADAVYITRSLFLNILLQAYISYNNG